MDEIFEDGGQSIDVDYQGYGLHSEISSSVNINESPDDNGNGSQDHLTPIRNQGSSSASVPCFTPNGTRYFIPEVPLIHKPVVGTTFNSLDEALFMYESYAKMAGFTVRKSTAKHKRNGELTHRLYVCNREGKPRNKRNVDSLKRLSVVEKSQEQTESIEEPSAENEKNKVVRQRRNSNFKVTNCYARIKLRMISGTDKCVLYGFVEEHNHLLDPVEERHLSRAQRQLEFEDRRFIKLVGMNNIGPVRAYRLRAALNGGYDQVRGTEVDYKNHKRDVNLCIGERDAQMLVNKFADRKLNNPEMCFEYKTDNNELVAFFWADETSRCNFRSFGDVLAFDATYSTNRYDMVFVPFTGVDHHNKCVTFGGGLLKYETIESYKWLLNAFLNAHPNQPQLILTDQDPAMKEAIKQVFTESTHRLCMWHVMRKLPFKVCGQLLKNTDLKRRIHKLVWDVLLTVEKFETRWEMLIKEFNLENNKWLSDMFKIRHRWVPGFFSHLPMCCLMKTTSRSESSNSFFHIFTDPDHTLVQFMVCFEMAMEKQRHTHAELDYQTKTTTPLLVTELKIEEHAASVYTLTIFKKVQKEIYRGLYYCSHKIVSTDDDSEVYAIEDVNQRTKVISRHQVVYMKDGDIKCSCNHFGRHGWLCRHIFAVFNNNRIEEIPEPYIKDRWRHDVLPSHLLDKRHRYGMETDETSKKCTQVIKDIELIFGRLKNNPEKLNEITELIQKLKDDVLSNSVSRPDEQSKEDMICEMYNVTIPDELNVTNPKNVKTKGSGSRKRMVGPEEKHVQKRKRQFRMCKKCGEYQDTHDTRNCDKMKEKMLKNRRRQ